MNHSMNYKAINTAILESQDVPETLKKDKKFYDYLLGNSLAYFYCKELAEERTVMDKKIIAAGNILNGKFLKTLSLINRISAEHKIKFLLFKTYKYIPEVVDNDIDLFIKEKDFHNFMKLLEKEGFDCVENEYLKGICSKENFSTIEPRVNAAFHELNILKEEKIWEKAEVVRIDGVKVLKATKEVDIFHMLLNILYCPSYLKLYWFHIAIKTDFKKLYKLTNDKMIRQDLELIIRSLSKEDLKKRSFPFFMGDIDFALWWYRRILSNQDFTLRAKLKHVLFFFYLKYSYIFFNKLLFKHEWPLN